MVCVGRDLKNHPVPIPPPWAETILFLINALEGRAVGILKFTCVLNTVDSVQSSRNCVSDSTPRHFAPDRW